MARVKKERPSGFGQRLKELREAANMTQDHLATLAGLNRFSVAKIEQGHRDPNWPTVVALARALGCSCEAFMEDGGKPKPSRKGKSRQ